MCVIAFCAHEGANETDKHDEIKHVYHIKAAALTALIPQK